MQYITFAIAIIGSIISVTTFFDNKKINLIKTLVINKIWQEQKTMIIKKEVNFTHFFFCDKILKERI